MYHQVELQKTGDGNADLLTYWLWVSRELRTGDTVQVQEENNEFFVVRRTFMSLKELDTLPKRCRLGHIQPRGDEHEAN